MFDNYLDIIHSDQEEENYLERTRELQLVEDRIKNPERYPDLPEDFSLQEI